MISALHQALSTHVSNCNGGRCASETTPCINKQFKKPSLPTRDSWKTYEKLAGLTQVHSASEYIEKFSELAMMPEAPYNNPKLLLDLFVRGLKADVRAMVQVGKPADSNTAFEQTQEMDEILSEKECRNGSSWNQRFMDPSPIRDRHPDATDIDAIKFQQRQAGPMAERVHQELSRPRLLVTSV